MGESGKVEIKRTSCYLCSRQCGVRVHVQDQKVLKVEGDLKNPVGKGFTCERARAAIDFHEHPKRLNYPLKRVGERGEDRWERIAWKQAMDEIARKLKEIRDRYGPEALAVLGGAVHGPGDWAAWRFTNLFGTPNIFYQGKNCGEAEFLMECAVYGYQTYHSIDTSRTKCMVVWGGNPAASNIPYFKSIIEAKKNGAKLIVVDPRLTETAERADIWLQLRPGTDGALALGMLNIIINEQLYDKRFVDNWCLGFNRVKETVQQYPPEKVEGITWVPKDDIASAARAYATHRPAVLTMGVATCHIGTGAKSAVQAKAILRAITGNLDIQGGDVLGREPQKLAWLENLYWDSLVDSPQRKRDNVSADKFPIASVNGYKLFRKAMKKVYPRGYGAAMFMLVPNSTYIWSAIAEGKPYPVKAIITEGGNPLCSLSNAKNAFKALMSKNLELHVAMDFFMTPTSQLADYVLPAADWLERPNLCVRWGMQEHYVAGEQSVAPMYERKNDYQFWRELGIRLDQRYSWPETLEEMYNQFLKPWGKTFGEFVKMEEPWYFPPPAYKKYERQGFATFSGKVELAPSILEKLGYDPLPTYVEPARSPMSTPELAKEYPFILISGSRVRPYVHSCYREEEKLRARNPDPLVQIHPDIARQLGVNSGDWVTIETPEGKIRQKAEVTERIHPKVVHVDGYWWFPEQSGKTPHLFGLWESNANAINPDDPELCDYAGDLPFRATLCKVYTAEHG